MRAEAVTDITVGCGVPCQTGSMSSALISPPPARVPGSRSASLTAMFNPKSVALVGASDRVGTVGATVLANLRAAANDKRLYCVNPKRADISGLKSYPTLSSLPEPVELVVIATPAITVPSLVREAVQTQARSIVVISAGFRERG